MPLGIPNRFPCHDIISNQGEGEDVLGRGEPHWVTLASGASSLTTPLLLWGGVLESTLPHLVKPGSTPHRALLSRVVESSHVALCHAIRLQYLQRSKAPHETLPGVWAQPAAHCQAHLMVTLSLALRWQEGGRGSSTKLPDGQSEALLLILQTLLPLCRLSASLCVRGLVQLGAPGIMPFSLLVCPLRLPDDSLGVSCCLVCSLAYSPGAG